MSASIDCYIQTNTTKTIEKQDLNTNANTNAVHY